MFGCTTEFRLRDILEGLTRDQHIIAQDVKNKKGDIIKRYIKGRVDQLKQLWASQPGWVAPHWYEICLERPTRLFMDIESTAPADVVQRGLTAICKYIEYDLKVVPEVINSCSEQKQSYHIVAPVFFKNVYHVGAWVRKCYQYMQTRIAVNKENHAGISLEDVRAVHEPECIIDTVVYTRNRAFRMCGSSKLGSPRVLTHPRLAWHDLMVQPALPPGVEPLTQLEFDDSEPVSTSMPAGRMFHLEGDTWQRTNPIQQHSGTQSVVGSFPRKLEPVVRWLEDHWLMDRDSAKFNLKRGTWLCSTRCHRCLIAEREHRGNHVFLVISPNGRVIQRCHDEECQRQFMNIDVPEEHWASWFESWYSPMNLTMGCQKRSI